MLKYLDIFIDILLILIILFITFFYMLDILRKPKINLIYNFKDMDKNKLFFIMNHFNSLNELCNKIDNNKNDVIIDIKKC